MLQGHAGAAPAASLPADRPGPHTEAPRSYDSPGEDSQAPLAPHAPFVPDPAVALTAGRLAGFLRNPVRTFFRERLGVVFDDGDETLPDTEAFGLDALEEHRLIDELTGALLAEMAAPAPAALPHCALEAAVERHLQRIQRAGRLPIGGLGARTRAALGETLVPMLEVWQATRAAYPQDLQRLALRFEHAGTVMEDWLDHRVAAGADGGAPLWLGLEPGRLLDGAKKNAIRAHKLLQPWVRSLLAAAAGAASGGLLVGRDATLRIAPLDADTARATLAVLIDGWRQGQEAPLPVALETALAQLGGASAAHAYEGSDHARGEGEEASLARCYPDFAALAADGRFAALAQTLYAPLLDWIAACVDAVPHAAATPAPAAEAA